MARTSGATSAQTPPPAAGDVGAHADDHGHGDIHLPPNSWIPVGTTLALTALLVGFIVGPWLWILGALATAACCVAWFSAARHEYRELPD